MDKKILTSLFLGLIFYTSSNAQTVKDIFTNYDMPVTWYGIDYSHSKIIGSIGNFGGKSPISPQQLRDSYYPAWNYLILAEPEKYNLQRMIHRDSVAKDLSVTKDLNAAVSIDSMEAPTTPFYSQTDIQRFISNYMLEGKNGIGLVFIAESMNKPESLAYYHVVFFNTETKEVLLQQRLKGSARGFGLRNYWAGSYGQIMEEIRENQYAKWEKEYVGKPIKTKTEVGPKW